MKIIVCLDDHNGMLFGNKRQSKDRFVIEDILLDLQQQNLYIHPFSASLFQPDKHIIITQDLLKQTDGICFVENLDLLPYEDVIDTLIIYRWNRHYPATKKFDLPLEHYHKIMESEFAGYSHDNITKEIYHKCTN